MSAKRILIVDDDAKTVELVGIYLKRDGYRVINAYNGTDALRLARESSPDLIVLDLMLPGIDGFQICSTLRSESDIPIIMLTARTSDRDKLTGLDMGADDYVTKPFSPRELAARVRAVLRRIPEERGPTITNLSDLLIDYNKHEAYLAGILLSLTPAEFKLLGVLAREPGRVFSRSQLIERAMGYDFEGYDRTIDVHILNLRRKIDRKNNSSISIRTVYGAGYKLVLGEK